MTPSAVPPCLDRAMLVRRPGGGRLVLFESLPSTNGWALKHADSLRHRDAVCAIRQTAGHGRFEREWISPADRGLAVTLLLRPPRRAEWMAQRSGFAAALAVRGMLASFGLPACVKWPNDVLVGGRKIAGVLAEREDPAGPVALGIGVNVNLTRADFRGAKLLYPATSMRLEAGREFVVADVCSGLLDGFDAWWLKMKQQGPQGLRRAWARHDFLRGRIVTVSGPTGADTGRYAGMDEEGRLVLRLAGGETRLCWSGDVSVTSDSE